MNYHLSLRQKIMLVAALAALSGIVEITPLATDFRFAVASVVLFFFLLAFPELPPVYTGLATFGFIFVFRCFTEIFIISPDMSGVKILWDQFPGAFYYFLVGFFLYLFRFWNYRDHLWIIFLMAVTADISANLIELVLREGWVAVNINSLSILGTVSGLRQIWVVGMVALVRLKQYRTKQEEERLRFDKVMMMVSTLYGEAFFLKKMFADMEAVTNKSYRLYREVSSISLSSFPPSDSFSDECLERRGSQEREGVSVRDPSAELSHREFSSEILDLARKVHEIKKDTQRVLAGVDRFIYQERYRESVYLNEIFRMVVRANQNLAQSQGKAIIFQEEITIDFPVNQIYPVTSILNNLVVNAVEAIYKEGIVWMSAFTWEKEYLCIQVADSGKGIPVNKRGRIFDAGYTTKFSPGGEPSTGIGLNYVYHLTQELDGWVEVYSGEAGKEELGGADFRVYLSQKSLQQEVSKDE